MREHKKAIEWTIDDIKGISPSICMHKILFEESYKPTVQPRRKLNPSMQEMVKKEVVKLLDAGIIYPISDSTWASPIQVVPKKGGITVVKNDNNELIPTRTITGSLMMPQERITFLYPSLTKWWRDFPIMIIIVFYMDIQDTIKSP